MYSCFKILFLLLFINECLGQEPGGQSTDGSQEHQRGKGPCPGLGQARLLGKGKQRPGDQLEQRPAHEDRGRQDAAQAAHHAVAEALPAGGIAHGAGTVGRDAQPQRNDEQQGHAQAGAAQAQGRSGDAGQQAGQDHGLAVGLEALFADPGQKRRPGDEAHGAHGQDVADEAGRKAEGPAHVDRAPKAVEHEILRRQGQIPDDHLPEVRLFGHGGHVTQHVCQTDAVAGGGQMGRPVPHHGIDDDGQGTGQHGKRQEDQPPAHPVVGQGERRGGQQAAHAARDEEQGAEAGEGLGREPAAEQGEGRGHDPRHAQAVEQAPGHGHGQTVGRGEKEAPQGRHQELAAQQAARAEAGGEDAGKDLGQGIGIQIGGTQQAHVTGGKPEVPHDIGGDDGDGHVLDENHQIG